MLPETDVPGITAILGEFHTRLVELQTRFLRIIAVGLGVDEHYFDSMIRDGATLSRAIHYPAMAESPGAEHVWAAEHGDINLVTALPRATARGLQVKLRGGDNSAGEWVDAVPPDDHVILNTGLMLERLTNGRLAAGRHRVIADPAQPGERMSVVQFLHPSPWTILDPLETCVTTDRPRRWAAMEAGAMLDQVLYDINLIQPEPLGDDS